MINTDDIVLLENGSRQWVHFNVYRGYDNGLIENLVLMNIDGGDYVASLYSYDFDEEDINAIENGNSISDLYYKAQISNISGYESFAINRGGGYSYTVYSLPDGRCGVFDHVEGQENGVIYMAFVVVPCTGNGSNSSYTYNSSDSGPNNHYSSGEWSGIFNNFIGNNNYYDAYGDGGSSGPNGSNGGFINLPNDPNDYYLSITFPLIPPETDNNIIALNDITTNVRKPYKNKITELVNGLNDTQETGFEFRTNDINNSIETIQPPSTFDGVSFPTLTEHSILRMHNHHTALDPIFSGEDIIGMGEFFAVVDDLESPDAEEITSLLVTERGLFALRVDDPDKAVAFNDNIKNGDDENGKSFIDKFKRNYELIVLYTPTSLCNGCTEEEYYDLIEEYLPTFLDMMDTGLTVYKGTDNGDGTYTWEEL